jgi:pimeloyl-ACP methyl ester carboxylesterase
MRLPGAVAYDHPAPPGAVAQAPPLLLIHSINATASAVEMAPLRQRHAAARRVVMLDLPGFGAADKPDRRYDPPLMQQAIVAALDQIDAPQVDIVALSLGCEFATEAVLQRPARVRSLAMISPTGMARRHADERWRGGQTRESRWLRDSPLGRAAFKLLTQGHLCAAQPGAHHAALDFVSGARWGQLHDRRPGRRPAL